MESACICLLWSCWFNTGIAPSSEYKPKIDLSTHFARLKLHHEDHKSTDERAHSYGKEYHRSTILGEKENNVKQYLSGEVMRFLDYFFL